jgi:hypothetical protein
MREPWAGAQAGQDAGVPMIPAPADRFGAVARPPWDAVAAAALITRIPYETRRRARILTRRGDRRAGNRKTFAGVRKCAACFLSLALPSSQLAASPLAPVCSASVCSAGRHAAAGRGDGAGSTSISEPRDRHGPACSGSLHGVEGGVHRCCTDPAGGAAGRAGVAGRPLTCPRMPSVPFKLNQDRRHHIAKQKHKPLYSFSAGSAPRAIAAAGLPGHPPDSAAIAAAGFGPGARPIPARHAAP